MPTQYEIKLSLRKIMKKLDVIDGKISNMSINPGNVAYLSVGLQATVKALRRLKDPVAAEDIASITGRARANESMHLNELFRQGLVLKSKRGREKLFVLKEEYRAER